MSKIYPNRIEWLKTSSSSSSSNVHMMSLRDLQDMLQVDINKGLSWSQVNDLQKKYGKNQIKIHYGAILKAVFFGLVDYFSLILWLALFISIVLFYPLSSNDPTVLINTGIIAACFIAKSILIALQEYNTLKSAKCLNANDIEKVNVLRESKWSRILASELVVGDVVEIYANQHIPADMRLFLVNNLRLDKSILTGESEPIEAECSNFENVQSKVNYYEAKNMAFMNFFVLSGSGKGVVVAVLNQTYMKEITKDINSTTSSSLNRVNRGLNLFALSIILFAFSVTLIYILIWLFWLRFRIVLSTTDLITNIFDLFTAGIPFGISVSITAGLLIVLKKLNKSQIIVKSIFDIPWMSNIDVVLTDKTGTLTYNSIKVANVLYSTKEIDVDLCVQSSDVYLGAEQGLSDLLDLCDFCTNDSQSFSQASIIERVLLEFAQKNRPRSDTLCKTHETVAEIEFNSRSKYHARLVKPRNVIETNKLLGKESKLGNYFASNTKILMIRGAPDFLLYKCKYILKSDGVGLMNMDNDNVGKIMNKMVEWSMMGKRLLCLCKKNVSHDRIEYGNANEFQNWFNSNCNDLVFVGLIGFMDSPRPDIKESVTKIREMGVRVVMVTGDYSITAATIASQVGILSTNTRYETLSKLRELKITASNNKSSSLSLKSRNINKSIVLNGKEIEQVTNDEWKCICNDYDEIILSRANPSHKLLCVKQFQLNAYSVLMVGDGANDVPALKRANLSVAMGCGSKMAANVSKVVLANSSFSGIHDLILNGLHALLSLKKIIIYSMISSVFSQYVAILLTLVLGIPQLYSDHQMLFVSALTDVLPSISLFLERPERFEVKKYREKLIDSKLIVMAMFMGTLTTALAYFNYLLYFKLYYDFNISLFNSTSLNHDNSLVSQSIGFYSIVCMQAFGNLYSIRTRNSSLVDSFLSHKNNFYLILASFFVWGLTTLLVSFPLDGFTMNIPWIFYLIPLACSIFILLLNELRKFLANRFKLVRSFLFL